MKSVVKYLSLLLIVLLCASTCKKDKNCPNGSHDHIYIKNNSGIIINWVNGDYGADSIWRVQAVPSFDESFRLISPNAVQTISPGVSGCWDYYYSNATPEYYFFFDHDTVRTTGWQAINGTNRGLLKRMKVDLNYLQTNDFTIAYP